MMVVYIISGIIILFFLLFVFTLLKLLAGRKKVAAELESVSLSKMKSTGEVSKLSILPLIDYYDDGSGLQTEAGVSYLVKADGFTMLMDMGLNAGSSHPSPLLNNMNKLGVQMNELDAIFISHVHLDHVGGMSDQKNKTFSPSAGEVTVPSIPVYSPEKVSPSARVKTGSMDIHVAADPMEIAPGIYSMGAIPRFLYLMGYTLEHVLAVRLKGRGIVLVIGCGHPSIDRILERAKMLFDEPVYAVIGGLHLPVKGGRIMIGPVNIQRIVGSDRMPWNGINEEDVRDAIQVIDDENPGIVALSPHDSSDWALDQFSSVFGDRFSMIRVGSEITLS